MILPLIPTTISHQSRRSRPKFSVSLGEKGPYTTFFVEANYRSLVGASSALGILQLIFPSAVEKAEHGSIMSRLEELEKEELQLKMS
ncbi:hypothetical protein ES319_D06G070200v1 [Gossypium barbadense]|uniref:Uncharacterized protein n=2 Tax=Gossypium TaxID=3633 RepID=A0A5J5QYY7_GOSBA|nr:hypothetical protein ES319_D06G070200v1 [Gossypium barbadense]TYG64022.1 hypothetical protein ES288_D06G075600v1 [Gossypium darwinii]